MRIRTPYQDWGAIERRSPSPLEEVEDLTGKAIIPGDLPLQFIRGIAFPGVILQCRDDSLTVSGSLSPDVTGAYVPLGIFSGYQLYILPGAPSYFCFYNVPAATYVLSTILSTGALTDFWRPTVGITNPNGVYEPQGVYTGIASVTDNPVDLTGYTAEAHIKRNENDETIYDLNPTVTDAPFGEITIPFVPSSETILLENVGNFHWDLVLKDSAENRFGPYISSVFTIVDNFTQP